MGEEKRHEVMETLFGEGFEDSEDEHDVQGTGLYSDDEGGVGEAESGGERSGEREASDVEREDSEEEQGLSEGERDARQTRYQASDEVVGEVSASESEGSQHVHQIEEDEEVEGREPSEEQGDEQQASGGAPDMREVFGESDEDEQEVEGHHHRESPQRGVSDAEDTDHKGIRALDIVQDGDEQYESDEQQVEYRKDKPMGPPLEIEIPLQPSPVQPERMNLVRISNIMDIEQKPFDPKTYVEEATFVTDEAGQKQRLRLEENVVRWRLVRNRDGSTSVESNARFVKWSDGSMQLLIGSEVLDLSVQDTRQDQSHLFLRHPKGILQAQGRLERKMRFMPSSLTSKSHRLLTALVDSRHKKVFKVKNVIINTDPEKEKEEKEKLAEQKIRSREDLQRKQERINRKYAPVREREPQLSPGYLEGALDEEDEPETMDTRRFQEQLDAESRAEKRIINAKKQMPSSREHPRHHMKDRKVQPRFRRGEEYISEESDHEPEYGGSHAQAALDEDEEEQPEEDDDDGVAGVEEEEEEAHDRRNRTGKHWEERNRDDDRTRKRKDRDRDEEQQRESSPPRRTTQRRRVVVSDSEED